MIESTEDSAVPLPRTLGRYELLGSLASGGMATVYLARHAGEAGFQRLYAIKVLHAHLAEDEAFVNMLLDEARLAALLHHPNVVPIVDLGSEGGFRYLAMEYVEGASLARLLKKHREERPPARIVTIALDMLAGLHAAHELVDGEGVPIHLVHRDVSPQNLLVGADGMTRVIDFGIAKAEARINNTRPGEVKGKFAFMSPEQIEDPSSVDRRADVFAAGVVLWSSLTGLRLFQGDNDAATVNNILNKVVPKPSTVGLAPPAALDDVILRALARDPKKRFATAADMEDALRKAATQAGLVAPKREVAQWVTDSFKDDFSELRRKVIKAVAGGARASNQTGSGPRPIPRLEAPTPSASVSISRVHSDPSSETIAAPMPPIKRNDRRIYYAIATALLVGAAIFISTRHGASTVPPEASAAAPPQGPAASPAGPAAKEPAPVDKPSVASAVVAAPVQVSAQPPAAPMKPNTAAGHPVAVSVVKAGAAAPTAASPPPPPLNDPKKKGWDSDSPLPPP